jgi:hypothetical protein
MLEYRPNVAIRQATLPIYELLKEHTIGIKTVLVQTSELGVVLTGGRVDQGKPGWEIGENRLRL